MTPTARTLKYLRELGYTCEIVERWNPHSRTRHDLFGMFDILTMDTTGQLGGVQCCAGASHAARATKLRGNSLLARWLQHNGAVVISWAKRGPRGKRKVWTPRIETL